MTLKEGDIVWLNTPGRPDLHDRPVRYCGERPIEMNGETKIYHNVKIRIGRPKMNGEDRRSRTLTVAMSQLRIIVPVLAVLLTVGCGKLPARDPKSDARFACDAKGIALIGFDVDRGEPCASTELRLRALLELDADCRTAYGKEGSAIADICK